LQEPLPYLSDMMPVAVKRTTHEDSNESDNESFGSVPASNDDHSDMTSKSLIEIEVVNGFDATEATAVFQMHSHQLIADLKLLLEPLTDIPAFYQRLFREGALVPLQAHETLVEAGISSRSVVLLVQQRCEHPEIELADLCASRSGENAPSRFHIQYLLRALPAEVQPHGLDGSWINAQRHEIIVKGQTLECCRWRTTATVLKKTDEILKVLLGGEVHIGELQADGQLHWNDGLWRRKGLQTMFETALLGGNEAVAGILAQDDRVDVNALQHAPWYGGFKYLPAMLIEHAAMLGKKKACLVLIESGRLNIESCQLIMKREEAINEDDPLMTYYEMIPDPHVHALYGLILDENWDNVDDFCWNYIQTFRRAYGAGQDVVSGFMSSSEKRCSNIFARAKKHVRQSIELDFHRKPLSKCEQRLKKQIRDAKAAEHKRRLMRSYARDKKWGQRWSYLDQNI